MLYLVFFLEFCKIGILAVGGGLVTIPFLFAISEKYGWYTKEQVTDFFAISQSLPGPIGNNIAVFVGYATASFWGALLAIVGLTIPAYLIISLVSKYIEKYQNNPYVENSLFGMRAASVALILFAGIEIFQLTVVDYKLLAMFVGSFLVYPFIKKFTVPFIFVAGAIGIFFKL